MANRLLGPPMRISVTEESERRVINALNTLLSETRRQAPAIIKRLARGAANSAAKLTIPNKGRNLPRHGERSSVRRPSAQDKFRELVNTSEAFSGNFYVVKNATARSGGKKRSNRRNRRFSGYTGQGKRAFRASGGEMVIYTTKRISQKDKRFKKIKKLIKIWDKKRRSWKYMPTTTTGKYERKTKWGEVPYYFAAKQAWLYSAWRLGRMQTLNKAGALRKLGTSTNRIGNVDNPSITMHNHSEYASKSGGSLVPQRALYLAWRGYQKELQKRKQMIIEKARRA